jgi:hypothetical protein
VSERVYGGFGEHPLREAVIGAARGTFQRAVADLLDERDELRDALRLLAHRVPWDGSTACWCAVAPFDDGSTRTWQHDLRCHEIRGLIDD